jgi:RHS repeat-associated protein
MIIGDRLRSSVDSYSGAPAFSLDLVSLPGRNGIGVRIALDYFGRVEQPAATWNLDAPTGLAGLGWHLPLRRIIAVPDGVAAYGEPTYFLIGTGGANRLLQSGTDGVKRIFTLENWQPWKITYDPASERWEVIDEDGTLWVYGDVTIGGDSVTRLPSRNTVLYNVRWGNWIGPGNQITNQRRFVTGWNLAEVTDRFGDSIVWYYDNVEIATSTAQGLAFTAATYPLRVINTDGQSVTFRYGEKTAAELQPPHTDPLPPNAWQNRFETRFLAGVDVFAANGNPLYSENLDYGAPTFLGSGNLTKRLLLGLNRTHPGGAVLPGVKFEYWGQNINDGVSATTLFNQANGALYGAMKRATLPEGGTYTWEYQSLTPAQSNRSAAVTRPTLSGVTFSKPRVLFGDAYTVVTWLGTGSQTVLAMQAFTWDGQWIPSPVSTITIPSSAAYDAALLAGGEASFAIYVNAQLYPYALDTARAGMLIAPQAPYAPALDGGDTALLAAGDAFAAVAGSVSGKLYRYRFDGTAWQADPLITLSAGGTPAIFTINARRNVLSAAGIRTGVAGAPLVLTLFRRDGTGAWVQSTTFQTALALAPVDSIALFGGDTFVVYRGVRNTGPNLQVKFGVAVWNPGMATITDTAFDTLVLAPGSAIPDPAIDQSLAAVGQMTYRYDGTQWIRFDVASITYPNQQAVEAVGVASDLVVRRIRTTTQWVDDLFDFNPNTGTWSNPAAISVTTATVQPVAAPRRGETSNYAVVGGTIRYHSWSGQWTDTQIGLAGIASAADADSVQLLPDFILYQAGSGTGGASSRVFFLANGTATSNTPLPLAGQQFIVAGKSPETLVGSRAFLTYTGTWDTPASVLTLYRVSGTAISGAQLTYAVRRITGRNGYPPGDLPSEFPVGYQFDVTKATMDPGGTLPQFNLAKVLPGDNESSYGSKATAFFNGLPPGIAPAVPYPVDAASANAQDLYSLAKGIVYVAENRIAATIATSSSLTRYQWITVNRVAACGISFYARSRRIGETVDGVVATTTNEFSADTGLVVRTTRDNTDIDGRQQFYKREFTYFWEKYNADRSLNILTPIVQQIDKTRTPAVSPNDVVTANQVTTWKSEWGSGTGQWAPYKVFAARAADATFNAWQPADPDPTGWLRVTTATARDSHGLVLRTSGIGAQPLSAGYDSDGTHLVWMNVNGNDSLDEVAYFGCEPYELTWGWAWSVPPSSIWDFITTDEFHTGTQSISLPPRPGQKAGPTRVFQPATQHRRFLFSLWARRDNGFNAANGKAYVEIAVRDVTANEWLTPISIEITSDPGMWGYIQRVLDLDVLRGNKPPADVLALHVVAYNQNSTTLCHTDELRFCPLDSTFKAAVYDPTRFDVTAAIGQNGQNVTTLYDQYARPVASISALGRVQSLLSASYSRSLTAAGTFLPSYPNSTLQLGTSSFSRYYDFHDGNAADWTFSDPAQWQIASGALQHRGTSSAPLGSTAQLKIVAFRNFAARIIVRPGTPAPTTIALGNNDVFMRWNGSQWQLVQLANNVVTILAVSSFQGFRGEWIYVCVDGFILCYVDGVQIFSYTYAYPSTPPPNWGKVTLAVSGDCDFDDLVVLQEPQLSLSFSDGLGQPMQSIALQGRAIDGPYANQYPTASTGTFYDALGRAQYARIDLTAPVAIAPPSGSLDTAASLVVADQSTYLRTGTGQALTVRQFLDGTGGVQYQQLTYEQSPLSRITRTVPPHPTASDAALAAADMQYAGAFVATQWLPPAGEPGTGGNFYAQSITYQQTVASHDVLARYQTINDRLGRPVTVMQGPAEGNPNTIGYVYDDAGNLATVRPPNYYRPPSGTTPQSWVEQREYDFLGPLKKVTTPDTGATQYLHDDTGSLRFEMNAAGAALSPQQIQYLRYDSLGRTIETGYIQDANYQWGSPALTGKVNDQQFPVVDPNRHADPNYAAGQWRKQFTWDYLNDPSALYAAGAIVQVLLNAGDAANPDKETYTYDAWGNVIRSVSAVRQFDASKEWTFLYDYDAQNHVSLITYPVMDSEPAFKVGYSYDRLGRLAAIGNSVEPGGVVDPDNPPPIPEKFYADIAYSPNGWIASETLNNAPDAPHITRAFSFSNAGALQSIADNYSTETIGWDGGGVMASDTEYFSGLVASDGFAYHAGPDWSDPPADYTFALTNDPTGELIAAANSLNPDWSQRVGAVGGVPYDANGNILATSRGITVSAYSYTSGAARTNRLDHITSNAADQLNFDGVPPQAMSYRGWSWGSNNGGQSTSFINTTQSHGGTQSLQLGGGSLAHYERLKFSAYLPPSGTLTIICWVKTAAGFDAAAGNAGWYVSLSGTRGELVDVRIGAVPAGATDWTQMTVTSDIAALRSQLGIGRDVDQVGVELRNYKRAATGSGPYLLVDDIALSATATGSFVYDASGRMTQSTGRAITGITYDPVSSLPRVIATGGTFASTTNLTYNAFDTRSLEVVTAGAATTKTLQLRGLGGMPFITRTTEAGGTVTTWWILGPGGIVAYKRGNDVRYVMRDHLGSTRLLVDGATGAAGDSIDYMPFGDVMRQSDASPIDYLFTGQQHDSGTGLYNYNARLYDPAAGRFMQPDAARQFATPYSYAGTQPFLRTDPSGNNALVVIRSTKAESFFDTPDSGHAGVLVQEPSHPGLWIYRDIIPKNPHKPYGCAAAGVYNVYWFEVYDPAATQTEPNYPSNTLRGRSLELSFRTKGDLIDHLAHRFPRFKDRPDAILEVALTPQQDRLLIDTYEAIIARRENYCTLGLNCVGFVEAGLNKTGVAQAQGENSWLYGVLGVPLQPLIGGSPLSDVKTPNSLYRAIAASGLNVTYHKDLNETRYNTITSASLGSNLVFVPVGFAAGAALLYCFPGPIVGAAGTALSLALRPAGFLARHVFGIGTSLISFGLRSTFSLLTTNAAVFAATLLSLPQPAGDPALVSPFQPTPGFLIGGDPEKKVIFADPGTSVSHVAQLTLGTLTAPAAVFNGYAYAGEGNTTAASRLHAWSLTTAEDAWANVQIAASVDATPVIQASTMYVAAANGFLYAYDISATDTSAPPLLWQLDVMSLGGATAKTTALVLSASGNEIYLVSASGIRAASLLTRTVLWKAAQSTSFTQAAPLYDGRLLLASAGSSLYAIDTAVPASGGVMTPKWTFNAGSTCAGPVTIAGSFGVIDATGKLHVVDKETGVETASLAGVIPASTVFQSSMYEDVVLAANTGGDLYARRIVVSGGALQRIDLWRIGTPAPINSAPIAFGGVVYVAPMGKLQAYRLTDSQLLWTADGPSNISRLGPLGLGLRIPQAAGAVKLLLDGPDFFLTLRNLLLAVAAGTFNTTTPAKAPSAEELLTSIGASGGNSYLMAWDTTDTKQFLRAWYLGPLLDLAGKVDSRGNLLSVRTLDGKPGVQAILVPYQAFDSSNPLYSQHQKIGIFSVGGTKLAFVGGFNLDTPLYWDATTHPMDSTENGRLNYHSWHDTALLVQGAAADLVEQHFDKIWNATRKTLNQPRTNNYAKLAFWFAKSSSCLDQFVSCSGQQPPSPYVNPSLSSDPIGVDLLITNTQSSDRITNVRARLVQRIMTATRYAYLENYAINDIELIRAIIGKLRNAPAGFQIILNTPHPTKGDDGDEQVAENVLTKMGYAAIFLDTQQWTSFTTARETIAKSATTDFAVVLDDRGPEFGYVAFKLNGTPRTVMLSQIRDIAAPAGVQPSVIFCSGARYMENTQPDDEKYELTGGVLSFHFRKIYIHSKLAIFDDRTAIIGSANLTERSLFRDGETNLCVTDAATVQAMRVRLFSHWGMTDAAQWYTTMNTFASSTAPALGIVPLTFAALPNDWPTWLWSWGAFITGISDYI